MSNILLALSRISAEQLLDADEVFITSTAGGIMPMTRINERTLSNGAPGPPPHA